MNIIEHNSRWTLCVHNIGVFFLIFIEIRCGSPVVDPWSWIHCRSRILSNISSHLPIMSILSHVEVLPDSWAQIRTYESKSKSKYLFDAYYVSESTIWPLNLLGQILLKRWSFHENELFFFFITFRHVHVHVNKIIFAKVADANVKESFYWQLLPIETFEKLDLPHFPKISGVSYSEHNYGRFFWGQISLNPVADDFWTSHKCSSNKKPISTLE